MTVVNTTMHPVDLELKSAYYTIKNCIPPRGFSKNDLKALFLQWSFTGAVVAAIVQIKGISLSLAPLCDIQNFLNTFVNRSILSDGRLDEIFRACRFEERKNSKAWHKKKDAFLASVKSVIRYCRDRLTNETKEISAHDVVGV